MATSLKFEWQVFDDPYMDNETWQQICGQPDDPGTQTMPQGWWRRWRGQEIVLTLAVALSLLLHFSWSSTFAAPKPDHEKLQLTATFDTTYFRYYYDPHDARIVKAVAANMDRWYARLRSQSGLTSSAGAEPFIIKVGILSNQEEGSLDLAGCIRQGKMLLLCHVTPVVQPKPNELTVPRLISADHTPGGPTVMLADVMMRWLCTRLAEERQQPTSSPVEWIRDSQHNGTPPGK